MSIRISFLTRYRVLPELAGPVFLPLGLFARLPLAMLTVGTLTLVSVTSGSYALGGLAAGAVGIGSALGAPILGALADRVGQRAVLLAAAGLNTAAVVAVVLSSLPLADADPSEASSASPAVVVAALAAGLTTPQVGPFARARWMGLTEGRTLKALELDAALSYEGTADEVTFVLGPALVGILGAGIAPWVPLAVAALLTATLVTAFALHPTAAAARSLEPYNVPRAGGRAWALVLVPVAAMIAMGAFFGSTQAALTAFAAERGSPDLGGLLYAAVGLTSAMVALSVAAWPRRFGLAARWVACAAAMLVFSLTLSAPHGMGSMTAALLLVGIPVGPIMVTVFGIGGRVAPAGRTSTVMTGLASGIVAGTALGSAIGGQLASHGGSGAAFTAPVSAAAALLALGLAVVVIRRA